MAPTFERVGVSRLASLTRSYGVSTRPKFAWDSSTTTGSFNTALGSNALHDNTTGYSNVAVGFDALFTNTTGRRNIAMSEGALRSNTIGHYNLALGFNALYNNSYGTENIALGASAMQANQYSHGNIAIGKGALPQHTAGDDNIAVGRSALEINTSGSTNVAIGHQAAETVSYERYDDLVEPADVFKGLPVHWGSGGFYCGRARPGPGRAEEPFSLPVLAFRALLERPDPLLELVGLLPGHARHLLDDLELVLACDVELTQNLLGRRRNLFFNLVLYGLYRREELL